MADWLRQQPGLSVTATADDDACAHALRQGAQILVTSTWRPDFLSDSLRWIAGCGTGIEQYPLELLQSRGITLTNAAGVPLSADDVAVVRRVIECRYLVFAAMILANNGWHEPVESARKLREAAGRFNVTKGAKP